MNPWLLILLALVLSTAAMTLAGWWLGAVVRRGWPMAFASLLCSLALSWTWNPTLSEQGIVSAWYAVLVYAWHGFPALELGILSLSFVVPLLAFFAAARFKRRRVAPMGVHTTMEPARTRAQIIRQAALPAAVLVLVLAFFPQVRQWPGMYAEKAGVVVDHRGEPMAGVSVWVTVYRLIDTWTRPAWGYLEHSRVRVVTDARGAFRVPSTWESLDIHAPLFTSSQSYWTAYPVKMGYVLDGDSAGWNFRSGAHPPHRVPSDWYIPEHRWLGMSLHLDTFVLEPVEVVQDEPKPAARPRQLGIGQAAYYYSQLVGEESYAILSIDEPEDRRGIAVALGRILCTGADDRDFDWATQNYLQQLVDEPFEFKREIDRLVPALLSDDVYSKRYAKSAVCSAWRRGMPS